MKIEVMLSFLTHLLTCIPSDSPAPLTLLLTSCVLTFLLTVLSLVYLDPVTPNCAEGILHDSPLVPSTSQWTLLSVNTEEDTVTTQSFIMLTSLTVVTMPGARVLRIAVPSLTLCCSVHLTIIIELELCT